MGVGRALRPVVSVVLPVVLAIACTPAMTPAANGSVVFAASSLKNAFTEIGQRYQADDPAGRIEFSFAGSADLLSQLTNGAPADVFASADAATMDKAVKAGLTEGEPTAFATNTLTIVVAPGNPKGVTSLQSLTSAELSVVLCASQVPCGAATRKAEAAAGVRISAVSEESQVTDVLTKVASGQADAGLVYVTDARAAADKVDSVAFQESGAAVNTYLIAALKGSSASARRFLDLVIGEDGREILAKAGFGTPPRADR